MQCLLFMYLKSNQFTNYIKMFQNLREKVTPTCLSSSPTLHTFSVTTYTTNLPHAQLKMTTSQRL